MSASTFIACPDRASWLLARRRGVGASEGAAVAGVRPEGPGAPPFKTALEVYMSKLGLVPEDDSPRIRSLRDRIDTARVIVEGR